MIVQLAWLVTATAAVVGFVWLVLASTRRGPPSLEGALDGWPISPPGGRRNERSAPLAVGLRSLLAQAGNRAPAAALPALGLLAGAAAAAAGSELGVPIWAVAGAGLVGACSPFVLLDVDRRRRSAQVARALPATLRSLSRLIGQGAGVQAALHQVVDAGRGSLSQELRRVAEEQAAGRRLPDALGALASRAPRCVELRILATAVSLSDETSLDLASLLRRIEERLSERAKRLAEARARTARARTQAALLVCMVPLAAGLIFLAEPTYLLEGWADPVGRALYKVAGLWACLGLLVIGGLLRSRP